MPHYTMRNKAFYTPKQGILHTKMPYFVIESCLISTRNQATFSFRRSLIIAHFSVSLCNTQHDNTLRLHAYFLDIYVRKDFILKYRKYRRCGFFKV